jgi:hypothetical protein
MTGGNVKIDKRVKRTALVALLGVATCVLLTCHTGPTDWTAFNRNTVEQNLATLDSATTIYQSHLAAGDTDAARQAWTFLLSQPGVDTASISPDSTVWAFFSNGLLAGLGDFLAGVSDSVRSEPAPIQEVKAQTGGELASVVHYILPFDVELPGTKASADAIKARLKEDLNWDQSETFLGGQVTIGLVRSQIESGSSVLFWAGHGDLVPPAPGAAEVPSLLLGAKYNRKAAAEEAVTGSAGYLNPGPGKPRLAVVFEYAKEHKFGIEILPAFIRAYGNFDKFEDLPNYNHAKTIVYLSCCFSAYGGSDGSNRGMFLAFQDVGADVVCGWDWAVSDDFAENKDETFFREMGDTCFPYEARDLMGSLTDPLEHNGGHATFNVVGDSYLMLRTVIQGEKDGTLLRASQPGASGTSEQTSVSSLLHAEGGTEPVGQIVVTFPGASPGQFDCATREYAVITWNDFGSGKPYFVAKGCKGVSGTINIDRSASEIITGRFSGELGNWGSNPPGESMPTEVVSFTNGMMKYTGKIVHGK